MKNKEKAQEVVRQFIRHLYVSGSQQEQVVDLIAQALREAEARGMERAAKIADKFAREYESNSQQSAWQDKPELVGALKDRARVLREAAADIRARAGEGNSRD